MQTITSISQLPRVPAVYALLGGRTHPYVAYVGMATNLRVRIEAHLVRRDSSITTGMSAATLNPEFVTEVHLWEREWERTDYNSSVTLEAAELIAFDVLEPALRSRGNAVEAALALSKDPDFRTSMMAILHGEPTGRLVMLTLPTALERIEHLDERIGHLEKRVKSLEMRLDDRHT